MRVASDLELEIIKAALEEHDADTVAGIATEKVAEVDGKNAFIRHIYIVLEQRRKMEPHNVLRMDLEQLQREIREELGFK